MMRWNTLRRLNYLNHPAESKVRAWEKEHPFSTPHPEVGDIKTIIGDCFKAHAEAENKIAALNLGPDTEKKAHVLNAYLEWLNERNRKYGLKGSVVIFDKTGLERGEIKFVPPAR